MGETDQRPTLVVCDAGPLIHDALFAIDPILTFTNSRLYVIYCGMIKRPLWLDRMQWAWSRRSIVWLSGERLVGKTTLA